MKKKLLDLSPTGYGRVVLWTVSGTLFCISATVIVDSFGFADLDEAARNRSLTLDIVLPILLAGPLIYLFATKLRDLAIAHEKLAVVAATDSLTTVLNRGAFVTLVDAYLNEIKEHDRETRGALLVIDADNFKLINDSYGHDRGDEALRIIANAIRSVVRSVDRVGRIGGEEFGVFLPGISTDQAEDIAERIRQTVSTAVFMPGGVRQPLTVSVGGAAFSHLVHYDDLFKAADQQLYAAKNDGRNRISVSPVTRYDTVPGPA